VIIANPAWSEICFAAAMLHYTRLLVVGLLCMGVLHGSSVFAAESADTLTIPSVAAQVVTVTPSAVPAVGPTIVVPAAVGATASPPPEAVEIVVPPNCTANFGANNAVTIVCPGNGNTPNASVAPASADPHAGMVQVERSYAGQTVVGWVIGGGIGSAVVHGMHNDYEKAAGALAMHMALPVTGALLGYAIDSRNERLIIAGAVVGVTTSVLIDLLVLSVEKVWVPRPSASAMWSEPKSRRVRAETGQILPNLAPLPGGLMAGASGRF
jgi:hypothetical protein